MKITSERMVTQSTFEKANARENQILTLTGLVNNSFGLITQVLLIGDRIVIEDMEHRYEYRGGERRAQVLQAVQQQANQAPPPVQAPQQVAPEPIAQPINDAQHQQ